MNCRIVAPLVSLLLSLLAGLPLAAAEPEEQGAVLPLVLERVAVRSSGNQLLRGRTVCDVTLDRETLRCEASREKKSFEFPVDSIRVESYGRMRGDVDTDWVILDVGLPEGRELVGLRDGRKFGYGSTTESIHRRLRAGLKALGAAQYDTPPGYRLYDELDGHFTLPLPEAWHSAHRSLVEVEDDLVLGRLVLTAEPVPHDPEAREEALRRFDEASSPGIFVHREEVGDGAGCEGWSGRARRHILDAIEANPLAGEGYVPSGPPQIEDATLDGCVGVRVRARGRTPGGRPVEAEYLVVTDDRALFRIGYRAAEDDDTSAREFERIERGFRFALGLPPGAGRKGRYGMD